MRMGLKLLGCTLVSGLTLGATAQAQEKNSVPQFSAAYYDCLNEAGHVDDKRADCYNDERGRQDVILNIVYGQLMAKLAGDENVNLRDTLRTAERAWIAHRDAHCDYEYAAGNGRTMARPEYSGCLLDMTHERILYLRDQLERF